jgi:hypothetical protein
VLISTFIMGSRADISWSELLRSAFFEICSPWEAIAKSTLPLERRLRLREWSHVRCNAGAT